VKLLRTPDARFEALPQWPFRPNYLDDLPGYGGIRVHYVDEGPKSAPVTALCLHGNPSWGYLYRKMIPVFATAGLRVVVPDLIGFGRSDKPAESDVHGFDYHRSMLSRLIGRLDLNHVMLVCQDWGGLLGLTLLHEWPQRFSRLLVMNTALATGARPTDGFLQWRDYSNRTPDLDAGKLIARGKPDMTPGESAAYNAPFPDRTYKAALRAFPNLVPDSADAPGAAVSRRAQDFLSTSWTGSSFMAIGMQDPVLGLDAMQALRRSIRGCPEPLLVSEAGHFVPEWGEPIAHAALRTFGLGSSIGTR
jgi:pimeloyl-ACP methyl ester carboxylesterase